MFKILAAAVIAATALASAADAATVSFDLTGGKGTGKLAHTFTSGGLGLTVSALRCTTTCAAVKAQDWAPGFGILAGSGDSHQVDGKGADEYLVFSFDRDVTLGKLSFSYADTGDRFALLHRDGAATVSDGSFAINLLGGRLGDYALANGPISSVFAVGAVGTNDAFKFRGLTVSFAEPQPAPVPLPAAGFLLLAGLGALAAVRRRG